MLLQAFQEPTVELSTFRTALWKPVGKNVEVSNYVLYGGSSRFVACMCHLQRLSVCALSPRQQLGEGLAVTHAQRL